ncbi:class I SAM-dependent methyltransferase [Aliikangiella sp. IMCC44653]
MYKSLLVALSLVVTSNLANAFAESEISTKVKSAMQSELRSDSEKERDANRKPIQTLEFFGLKPDMKVLELIPGGAWYSKILAPVLADKGDYHVAIGTGRVEKMLKENSKLKINVLNTESNIRPDPNSKFYLMDKFSFPEKDFDIIFTFRNYHNFAEAGRRAMNEASFAALKPGGIYAVVDHTKRHMEPLNPENGRRIDPVLAIKEIQEAGFQLLDYSDLHYRADDELRYEVGRRSISGNTDRFTLKFIKPKK